MPGYSRKLIRLVSLFVLVEQICVVSLGLMLSAVLASSPALAQTPSPASTEKTTAFFYDASGTLVYIEDREAGSIKKSTYIFGSYEENYTQGNPVPVQKRLTLPLTNNAAVVKENAITYLVARDYLSSTRVIVKDDGTITSSLNYYPYGAGREGLGGQGGVGGENNLPTDRLYTGQRKLVDVNLYYYGARFYSPTLGVFVQPDSVQGPNRYAYVGNNPIMANDPSGQAVADPFREGKWGINSLAYTPPSATNISADIAATQQINPYSADRDIPPGLVDATNFIFVTSVGGGLAAVLGPILLSAYLANPVNFIAGAYGLLTLAVPQGVPAGVGYIVPPVGSFGGRINVHDLDLASEAWEVFSGGAHATAYVNQSTGVAAKIFHSGVSGAAIEGQINNLKLYGGKNKLLPEFYAAVFNRDQLVGYTMEAIPGKSLYGFQGFQGVIPSDVAAKAKAELAAIQAAGFVHGDMKPGNIIIQEVNGVATRIRLIDPNIKEHTMPLRIIQESDSAFFGYELYLRRPPE